MSGWYVIAPNGEQELGPFTGAQLVGLAKAKRINGSTLLRNDEVTKGKRIAASSIKQLQEVFTAPPVAELVQDVEQHPEDAIIESGKRLLSSAKTNIGHTIGSLRALVPTTPAKLSPAQPTTLEATTDSSLSNFAGEGQDTAMVAKLLERVNGICTSSERPLYMAIQQRPVANFSPDAVVLTTNRLMLVKQKILGRMQFFDYLWRDVSNVHIEENILSSTFSFAATNGRRYSMDWLPKDQARKVYRIAQEQEEAAHQIRREIYLEEKRASVAQTVINTNVQAIPTQTPAADPVAKLQQLKQMLDAQLITQQEYDAKKAELLAQM